MKFARLLFIVSAGLTLVAPAVAREEAFAFEGQRIVINVPDGFAYKNSRDLPGIVTLKISNAEDQVSLQVTLLPDPEQFFSTSRARKEFLVEKFRSYADDSVEKAMQFEELAPRAGAGTYCDFTDAKLADRADLPPNEYRHATTGIKAWPGVVAIYVLLSNDTKSKDYAAAHRIPADSLHEKALGPVL